MLDSREAGMRMVIAILVSEAALAVDANGKNGSRFHYDACAEHDIYDGNLRRARWLRRGRRWWRWGSGWYNRWRH